MAQQITLEAALNAIEEELNSMHIYNEQQAALEEIRSRLDAVNLAAIVKAPPTHEFRIMTWNLNMISYSKGRHIAQVVKVVTENHINMFCVQEVKTMANEEAAGYVETCNAISDKLEGHGEWEFASIFGGRSYPADEVIAVFYRSDKFCFIAKHNGLDGVGKFVRVPLRVEFSIKSSGVKFTVSNFHLKDGTTKAGKAQHAAEVELLTKYSRILFEVYNNPDYKFHLILGDFNCAPDELTFDCHCSAHRMKPENSSMTKSDNIYDSMSILSDKCDTMGAVEEHLVEKSETRLNNGQYVSDHLPVAFNFNTPVAVPPPPVPKKATTTRSKK